MNESGEWAWESGSGRVGRRDWERNRCRLPPLPGDGRKLGPRVPLSDKTWRPNAIATTIRGGVAYKINLLAWREVHGGVSGQSLASPPGSSGYRGIVPAARNQVSV